MVEEFVPPPKKKTQFLNHSTVFIMETHLGTEAGLVVVMVRLLYNGNTFRDRGWFGSGDG